MTTEIKQVKLYGRIFINVMIKAESGLHIGGSSAGMEIGGVDNPIIRNPLNQQPYIPGSSLRGKMRSLLEKAEGLPQNTSVGKFTKIHTCRNQTEFSRNGGCPVCHIFGVPGETGIEGQTLLLVRDTHLSEESVEELKRANTDLAYSELKMEVAIDRVTSAASPRNIERVPAGAKFGPAELVFNVYSREDLQRFHQVLDCLQLVEDDYLGGSGSRGSGKIKFEDLSIYLRCTENYGKVRNYEKGFDHLQDVSGEYQELSGWAKNLIFGG